jgi:hypothetical protein
VRCSASSPAKSTGRPPWTCSHSNEDRSPYTEKLSTYCRAVSKSDRVISALRSESRTLTSALSTANGEPYFDVSSAEMCPDPKQTTYSANAPARASRGPIAWVA